jgi:DNA-binding PadR family transcriptional regulator
VLEMAILGLLKELPLHGYELKKRLNDTVGHLWGVSYGSLYPALARLEKAGAIEAVDPAPAPGAFIPATGSISGEAAAARHRRRPVTRSGRTRKAYRIASRGQAMFTELLLADPPAGTDEDRSFALRLVFCRHLEPSARLQLLERRRAHLVEKLAKARQSLNELSRQGARADRYTRALIQHETTSTERDLEWVDALIADERQPAPTGGPPTGGTQ